MNAAEIPLTELLRDRQDSVNDIQICRRALKYGITYHRDGLPVTERIKGNCEIIDTIDAELKRRGFASISLAKLACNFNED